MSKGFDWPALMRAGLHGLGLKPDEFWALTPVELQLMLGSDASRAPMLSDGLAALMAAYPDIKKDDQDER
ncbi:rcc01693 family protein [Sulfitobacter sp. HNIBRBA2951]|uniref:rcc01693 family protein n=1 Tax=Sulfitobacter aquimarinus TaxID=3158557 RepID=UPI0032DFB274